MHTIQLKVEDNIYNNIMFMLTNLRVNGLEIKEIDENDREIDTKQKIKKLFSKQDVKPFASIDDPLKWQQEQREEW